MCPALARPWSPALLRQNWFERSMAATWTRAATTTTGAAMAANPAASTSQPKMAGTTFHFRLRRPR